MKKKSSKGLKALLIILIVVAAGVLGFSVYKLLGINASYKEANNLYEDVGGMFETRPETQTTRERTALDADVAKKTQQAGSDNADIVTTDNEEGLPPQQGQPSDPGAAGQPAADEPSVRYASLQWDFQKLLDVCEDGVGYIYQEGTKVSYPVVQAENNDKYLRHMINGEYNVAGSIFVDCNFPEGLNGRYSFIYGHNMDDKSMFGSITAYKDESYYKEHPEFELYVGDDCYVYYVFSAFQAAIDDFIFSYGFESDEDFLQKMQEVRERCPYPTDAPQITEDSIVTFLSTCIDYPRDYNYRYVVFLVRGEKLVNENGVSIRFEGPPYLVMDHHGEAFLDLIRQAVLDLQWERYIKFRGYQPFEKDCDMLRTPTFTERFVSVKIP